MWRYRRDENNPNGAKAPCVYKQVQRLGRVKPNAQVAEVANLDGKHGNGREWIMTKMSSYYSITAYPT